MLAFRKGLKFHYGMTGASHRCIGLFAAIVLATISQNNRGPAKQMYMGIRHCRRTLVCYIQSHGRTD